ncbi:MAG: alanine--tRNA ligase, partial [bacterium]
VTISGSGEQRRAIIKGEFSGTVAFDLYQTYGFPKELIQEELGNIPINEEEWNRAFDAHQNLSRKGTEQKFAGGLADHSERVVRMHTATHLLHQALKDVLGDHVQQKGSNITAERLRFDFTHPQKVRSEELQNVEKIVNKKIQEAIPVEKKILSLEEARKLGATGLFGEKYGDTVSVYLVGDYSKEFCGGPHVANTKEIGAFKILKEEAVSAGVRRIKAMVE